MQLSPVEIHCDIQTYTEVSSPSYVIKQNGENFFCSWSGGKDSALAFYRMVKRGAKPNFLLTMMIETGNRSRSHGIPKHILEEQALCIGVPIRFCPTSWAAYTENFIKELSYFKSLELEKGVFGDIDGENHLEWVETVCQKENIIPSVPLWQEARGALLHELIEAGFRAEIIAVKNTVLSPDYLGKILNDELIQEFASLGIDLSGEAGEYHTIVTDGPIFMRPLSIIHTRQVLLDGYWFSDIVMNLDVAK